MCVQKSYKFSNIPDKENCFLRKFELSGNQEKIWLGLELFLTLENIYLNKCQRVIYQTIDVWQGKTEREEKMRTKVVFSKNCTVREPFKNVLAEFVR